MAAFSVIHDNRSLVKWDFRPKAFHGEGSDKSSCGFWVAESVSSWLSHRKERNILPGKAAVFSAFADYGTDGLWIFGEML